MKNYIVRLILIEFYFVMTPLISIMLRVHCYNDNNFAT